MSMHKAMKTYKGGGGKYLRILDSELYFSHQC